MTIPSELNLVEIAGNGTLGPYAIPYWFAADSHLRVWLRDDNTDAVTEQVLNSDFQVFNANTPPTGTPGSPQGYINFLVTAPTTSQTVVIWRVPPALQDLSLPDQSGVPLRNYEGNYDLLVTMIHMFVRLDSRVVKLTDGATAKDMVIPAGTTDKWLSLDATGNLSARDISQWLPLGPPPPDNSIGNDGDSGYDNTGRVWYKTGGVWIDTGLVIQGAPGATGPNLGLQYDWDTATADADPGTGKLRINNVDPVAANFIYISKTDRWSIDKSATIARWSSSSSPDDRGEIRIVEVAVSANELTYTVVGNVVDATTYYKVPVQATSAGTVPTNNQEVGILFSRTGDGERNIVWCGVAGGTVDNITLTPSTAITQYEPNTLYAFIPSGTNTANMTADVSGLPAKAIMSDNNEVPPGAVYPPTIYYLHHNPNDDKFQIFAARLELPVTAVAEFGGFLARLTDGQLEFRGVTSVIHTVPTLSGTWEVLNIMTAPTVTNAGLNPSTFYYVYLYSVNGVATLELSATVPTSMTVQDTVVQVKTGETNRLLVGYINTDAATAFKDQSNIRFLRNVYNERPLSLYNTTSNVQNITSAAVVEFTTGPTVEFIELTSDVISVHTEGSMLLTDGSVATVKQQVFLNGTGIGSIDYGTAQTNIYAPLDTQYVRETVGVGVGYFRIGGSTSAGTATCLDPSLVGEIHPWSK